MERTGTRTCLCLRRDLQVIRFRLGIQSARPPEEFGKDLSFTDRANFAIMGVLKPLKP